MPELAARLAALTQKDPIVSTFDSRVFGDQHRAIITSYEHHAATYIEFDPLRDLEYRFIQKVLAHQTPKACLVGQYGQGKTTAAIGIWQGCQKARILATPPASYTSLSDLALGVYTWVQRTLQTTASIPTEALNRLAQLHQTYLQASTEDLARLVSRRSGRDFTQVLSVLTDPLLEKSLRLDPTTTNIVLFLDAVSQLVTEVGYSGLVIIVDEFQQLLGVAGPEILTGLRSLIWGLRTRQIALGLLITMDTSSERTLGERAGDILHRIKDDDLYLNFQQIYHPDFPRLLWERYSTQLNFNGLTYKMVDKPALEALGQICERPDLSNGPRTVVNVFRRIASCYPEHQITYNPLQLIEDFVSGAIIFDGDTSTIAGLVSEYANYPYFKRSEKHQAVLKLLAAFPDGCSVEIAERYGLGATFAEVTSELRGEIVTRLPNGYALIDLQRAGKPLDKLAIILKKYWLQISDAQLDMGETTRRFAQHILPLLFPSEGQPEVWVVDGPVSLSATDSYSQTFNGRLHTRHPMRRIATTVSWQTALSPQLGPPDCDLHLYFQLNVEPSLQPRLTREADGALQFVLNIATPPTTGLPAELRLVEHNLSPQPATPVVLLSVIEFIEREARLFDLSQLEQLKINRTLENIRRWLLAALFNDRLLAALDPEAATPGYRGFRDLLYRECERHFPTYRTLITSAVWSANLALYRQVLVDQPMAIRRGLQPLSDQKTRLASLFNQRTHAGFDSKLRVQYPDLLEIGWVGDSGSLTFLLHPLETAILSRVGEAGLLLREAHKLGRTLGYAPAEINNILELLVARGQTRQEGLYLYKVATLSLAEIRQLTAHLGDELAEFESFLPTARIVPALETARRLAGIRDEAEQELAHSQLVNLTEQATHLRLLARQTIIDQLDSRQTKLVKLAQQLEPVVPNFAVLTGFKSHLEGARKHLEVEQGRLQKQLDLARNANQSIRQALNPLPDSAIAEYLTTITPSMPERAVKLEELAERVAKYGRQVALLGRWISWGEAFERLRQQTRQLNQWLTENDPFNQQLTASLATLDQSVQRLLSTEGLEKLAQIEEFQARLQTLQLDCDRNLSAREEAFEQEKTTLVEKLTRLLNQPVRLKSKYQASKHLDSYNDLYEESQTLIQAGKMTWNSRLNQVDVGLNTVPKSNKAIGRTKQATRKFLTKARQTLASMQGSGFTQPQIRSTWRENLTNLANLLDQLTALEKELSVQPDLGLAIPIEPQPLSDVLNVTLALKELNGEAPLAHLLRCYQAGEINITVGPKLSEKAND